MTRGGMSRAKLAYLLVLVFSFSLLALGWSDLMGVVLLGRHEQVSTLTGRVPLWIECWSFVEQRPLTGYGYNGFWTEDRAWDLTDTQGWVLASSHSMYLETVLNLGLVGFFTGSHSRDVVEVRSERATAATRRADGVPARVAALDVR